MKKKSIGALVVAIVICQLAGAIGSVLTSPAIPGWYAGIVKPSFNPPSWIFGPVWITLYALMGIAAWLVWLRRSEQGSAKQALQIFGLQLALNALWSPLFFGLQNPGLAFAEIILLWLAIVATIRAFYSIKPLAAYLLVPYLAWVSFAAFLNYSIWQLN